MIEKKIKKSKTHNIPKVVKEQLWLLHFGEKFSSKCYVKWCYNKITVFDFHVGHNIPKSKGGTDNINNLKPICSRCNLSMNNEYTIDEWVNKFKKEEKGLCYCFPCYTIQ